MPITLVVDGLSYEFPVNRDSPSWGADVTSWASAITTALTSVVGTGDIIQTSAVIANNQTSAANINGLLFSNSVVRGAIIDYSIYRNSSAAERVEVGSIFLSYKTVATTWELTRIGVSGNAGVTFTISGAGQMLYTSDNQAGTSYTGTIHYRARALLQ